MASDMHLCEIKLQDQFDDYMDFLDYNELYGLAELYGYSSPFIFWEEDPVLKMYPLLMMEDEI